MKARSIISILLGLCLIIISGRVSFEIPLAGIDIPITGQSLAVLLIGYYLSTFEIIILFALYFIAGSINMPVYADGSYGIEKLWGKSGGYLYSFPIAAILISFLKSKVANVSVGKLLMWFIFATLVILVVGMMHLSLSIGISSAFNYGFKPFVLGGLVKCLMAVAIIKLVGLLWSKWNG